MDKGALGIKILGGHYPFTPQITEKIIEIANEEKAYAAFHVGTTETGSNVQGLEEALDLAGENRIHIAHVNSYCRGQVYDPLEEARRALELLKNKKNVVSESYLATINGTSAEIENGKPLSHVTRDCLRLRGYEETEKGLELAIKEGYGKVHREAEGKIVLIEREEAVRLWRKKNTDIGISFPVNSPISTFLLATAKHEGKFIVDAISTDGGGIPRNVIVKKGLLLVKYGALSLTDFVRKTSMAPAKMFNLDQKGHLGAGADADITVLDVDKEKATMAINRGKPIMVDGFVVGKGANIIRN